MRHDQLRQRSQRKSALDQRRGAVAVEFACVAPVMLIVIVGLVELSRIYSVQNILEIAAREGARFATIDRTGLMMEGQTANEKLIADVKDYIASNGIDPDIVDVSIVKASDPSQTFNLDDPENELELFVVKVEVLYSEIGYSAVKSGEDYLLSAALTFRNGRATAAQ